MNEHEQDPPLDPDQDARIRALLADLGTAPGETSMPPEVAARLDETLAELVAEREAAEDAPSEEASHSNVVPIRRRWATRAAAAAAAVIVVGAGGVAVANLGVFGGNAANDSTAGAGSSTSKAESLDSSATAPRRHSGRPVDRPCRGRRTRPQRSFLRRRRDPLAARPRGEPGGAGGHRGQPNSSEDREAQQDAGGNYLRKSGCPGPAVTDGALATPVRYDAKVAVLLVHPASGGARLVDVWTCSGDRKLDSASVPVSDPTSGQNSPGDPGLGSPSPTP